ncbi:MAG: hypothetical protein J0L99_07655 [Chitinophagales bacterium]|nr:hypothetical protein [Chitinophagales bacterium]
MTQKNLAPATGANPLMVQSTRQARRFATVLFFAALVASSLLGQNLQHQPETGKIYASIETDPAFWIGTLPNGAGFDANIDFRLAKHPRFRFGILGYAGKWSGRFGQSLLLSKDFTENNWVTQWNGIGLEAQYQFRFGLKRGGLQPGLRAQWNLFTYTQNKVQKGKANHFVITPQVGFQWFPFKQSGLYILPWAGAQIPVAGTDKINVEGQARATRKMMPVVTAHLGWEFKF